MLFEIRISRKKNYVYKNFYIKSSTSETKNVFLSHLLNIFTSIRFSVIYYLIILPNFNRDLSWEENEVDLKSRDWGHGSKIIKHDHHFKAGFKTTSANYWRDDANWKSF